ARRRCAGLAFRPQGRGDPWSPPRPAGRSRDLARRGARCPVEARTVSARRPLEPLPGPRELPRRLRGGPPCPAWVNRPAAQALRADDWLMIEIAVKLVRLKDTLEREGADTSGALRV